MDVSRSLVTRLQARIPGHAKAHRFGKNINDKSQSSFLTKLPLDIRLLIYQQVIFECGHQLHIALYDHKLSYKPCIARRDDFVNFRSGGNAWGQSHTWCKAASLPGQKRIGGVPHSPLLPLLLSCSRVSSEFADVIYSSIAFSLIGIDSAKEFLCRVPAQQLDLIKSLHISWMVTAYSQHYPTFEFQDGQRTHEGQPGENPLAKKQRIERGHIWKVISTMKRLRDLQVVVYDCTSSTSLVSERDMLEPLLKVIQLKRFVVELPWPQERAQSPIKGPFHVRRPMLGEEEDTDHTIDVAVRHGYYRPRLLRRLWVRFWNLWN